jgi:hypothetical protein
VEFAVNTSLVRRLWLALALCAFHLPAAANAVLDWNEVAFKALVAARQSPPMGVRSMAVVHAAMFDAMNAAQPRYRAFRYDGTPPSGASPDVAAAVAAHTALLKLFPEQRAGFDEALAKSLAAAQDPAARDGGAALGKAVAESLLAWCAEDRVGAVTQYRPQTRPGVYVMTTLPGGDDFGASRPWLLARSDQFRPPPPPALSSELWARDYEETRTVGARSGSRRTAEHTQVAQFWVVTGAPAFNGIIRQAVAHRQLDPLAAARVMALTYMAFNDALVAVFDAKYAYNFWRPITAVRNGDEHGNFAIKREPGWLPLVDAPLHPEYPCAHCISSATVVAVLQSQLGDDVPGLTMSSPTLPGVTRKWDRLSDLTQEVSNARIWSGVHYRNSAEVGARMGHQVAAHAVANYLQPK